MKSALIGYTGFVGSNLDSEFNFDEKFNSKNINNIKGGKFDLVICTGIPASMWMANNFPEKDFENINYLLNILETVKADNFILISSISVFTQHAININEDSKTFETLLAYGKNRRFAEEKIEKIFNNSFIIRLPALFGKGLKKNFIYDLLNQEPAFIPKNKFEEITNKINVENKNILSQYYKFDESKSIYTFDKKGASKNDQRKDVLNIFKQLNFTSLNFTNSGSLFQFYCLDNLFKDINIALKNEIHCLNLCSEPMKSKYIAKKLFNIDFNNENCPNLYEQDIKTKYAKYWYKKDDYQYSKEEVLKELEAFIKMDYLQE